MDGVFRYADDTLRFIVMLASKFNASPLEHRNDIVTTIGALCTLRTMSDETSGVNIEYIEELLDSDEGTKRFIGLLIDRDDALLGIIMFDDLRPTEPRVIRKFICGPKYGKKINGFFERHLIEYGKNLLKEGRIPEERKGEFTHVTVSLVSIDEDPVRTFHENMGYTLSPESGKGVMTKIVSIPPSGGKRKTRRRGRKSRRS